MNNAGSKEDLRIRLLIVDDEQSIRKLCVTVGEALGFVCLEAESGESALALLEEQSVHMVLSDMVMPHMSGLEFLEKVKKLMPRTEIALMTGHGSIETAVQAMKLGAYDYITKPFSPLEELRLFLRRMAEKVRLVEENEFLRQRTDSETAVHGIIGSSAEIQEVLRMVARLKDTRTPVLIYGESGTGKELVARAMHFRGAFSGRPFVAVDCGSLVPTLIESELFGYEKGAFTGALKSKQGLFQAADGGTIFLDEVGELPLELQAKLLRVLQEKEVRPVGSNQRMKVDVRVIAATNRDLEAAYKNGTFRKDLYFRLNVVTLVRSRIARAPQRHSHARALVPGALCPRFGAARDQRRDEGSDAIRLARQRARVGELRGACGSAGQRTDHRPRRPSARDCFRRYGRGSDRSRAGGRSRPCWILISPRRRPCPNRRGPLSTTDLEDIERATIQRVFEQVKGDKALAGRMLGISRATLYRKLKRYNISGGGSGSGSSSHTLQ